MARTFESCSMKAGYRHGKTVLIVDDEHVIRDLLKRTLLREGFEVITATDGLEAIERLESCGVDIVITDVTMPRMDGLALLQYVRKGFPIVPVILITGQAQSTHGRMAKYSGAEAFITKPFKNQEIRFVLQRTMLNVQKLK